MKKMRAIEHFKAAREGGAKRQRLGARIIGSQAW